MLLELEIVDLKNDWEKECPSDEKDRCYNNVRSYSLKFCWKVMVAASPMIQLKNKTGL